MSRGPGAGLTVGERPPRRLFVSSASFLTDKRLRRILSLAGWQLRLGLPGPGDYVAVWGHSPTAWRGEALARRRGAKLVRIEDAFLRSVQPGRTGEAPLGLLIDRLGGVHFDASRRSMLEEFLMVLPPTDTRTLLRARDGIERLKQANLSKYNAFPLDTPLPEGPFVLVVDQIRGDASIRYAGASEASFAELLRRARADHPEAKIVIKTHPETASGLRPGHFGPDDCDHRTELFTAPASPWKLLERASAVYTVSSQFGMEAIFAGHRPKVLGQPVYAGWGLTEDLVYPPDRRRRKLTAEQFFAVTHLKAPVWYDPYRDQLCDFECVADTLEAQARAWREDHAGYDAWGMRAWKRAPLQRFLGRYHPIRFHERGEALALEPAAPAARGGQVAESPPDAASRPPDDLPEAEDRPEVALPKGGWAKPAAFRGRRPIVWASRADEAPPAAIRVEDGFLRSRGLGAELVPPLSLVLDDLGIYYDPRQPSRLEALIDASRHLPDLAVLRAVSLLKSIIEARLSKYNLSTASQDALPGSSAEAGRRRILVPGQVEDDASILAGTDPAVAQTNRDLLRLTRERNPEALILYKPHPDVEAGLRPGAIPREEALVFADHVMEKADPIALIDHVDEVWTLTSLLGFEALLRGKGVTCLGLPFYAGWGLTRDLGPKISLRQPGVTLPGLIHAALIDYPRYHDPLTGLPCPPEVAVERLASPDLPRGGPGLRALAKMQGYFAGYAHLWRR